MLFEYCADSDHITVQNNVSQLLERTTEAIQATATCQLSIGYTGAIKIFVFHSQCDF